MIFSYPIITPLNTPIDVPVRTVINITKGVITGWFVFFPRGHWGECRLRVKKGDHPLLPANGEGYIYGDGTVFKSKDFVHVKNPPYKLDVFTWNLDTINAHELLFIVTIVPLWTLSPFSTTLMNLVSKEEIMRVV